jgi:hypothetical protein
MTLEDLDDLRQKIRDREKLYMRDAEGRAKMDPIAVEELLNQCAKAVDELRCIFAEVRR